MGTQAEGHQRRLFHLSNRAERWGKRGVIVASALAGTVGVVARLSYLEDTTPPRPPAEVAVQTRTVSIADVSALRYFHRDDRTTGRNTSGYYPLRDQVVEDLRKRGFNPDRAQVVVGGEMQGPDRRENGDPNGVEPYLEVKIPGLLDKVYIPESKTVDAAGHTRSTPTTL